MKTRLTWLLYGVLGFVLMAGSATAAAPTVNGLFYGDGDNLLYSLVGSNPGRGDMYAYLDGTTLYVAVVVSTNVNDNVFSSIKAYTQSAGWPQGNARNVGKLIRSDALGFRLRVGATEWTWSQDYARQDGAQWVSDANGDRVEGVTHNPPPGLLASSSSLVWNFHNSLWDYTMGNAAQNAWKSPDVDWDNDATDEDGFSTWSAQHQWEWTMVYEFSVNLTGYAGTIYIETISAHNSPSKSGGEDVEIPPGLDFGDAPNTYGTTLAANGPRHLLVVGGPKLGALVDAEADGQPTTGAVGDDISGLDDDDGLLAVSTLVPGSMASITVTGTAGAKLDAWLDFNANGSFGVGEQIATGYVLSGGADVVSFLVPVSAVLGDSSYLRLRVSTAGGLTPFGYAPDGEVEDYLIAASIGDYVWDDTDKDGIQDVGELGIDNITVELYKVGTPTPIATTSTDNTGYYLFAGLAPGNYTVKFIKPGGRTFSPQNAGADDAKDSDADTVTGETGTITLLAGESNTTIDAGMYQTTVLVTLMHFGAIERDGQVVVQWTTGEEFGTIGFFVERLVGDKAWTTVNSDLIQGTLFSTAGHDYEYVDAGAAPGATYIYRLVEIENTGNRLIYGPFTVDVPAAIVTGSSGESEPVISAPVAEALAPPTITDMKAINGNIVLRWASEAGLTYSIERIAELGGTSMTIATGVPATPPENTVILVDGAAAGFFVIQVED